MLDVGAHDGADSLPFARRWPHIRFVAIEPSPRQASDLRRRSLDLENYTVVEAAVARQDGVGTLNVYQGLERLNSLHLLEAEAADRLFGRSTVPDKQLTVPVKRLSTICDELGIDTVNVLHVDTQGSDLDVLESLDQARLESVRAGVIEVAFRSQVYDTSPAGVEACRKLGALGFRIVRVERDHWAYDDEQNVYLVRRRGAPNPIAESVAFRLHLAAGELRAGIRRAAEPLRTTVVGDQVRRLRRWHARRRR